MSDTPRRPPVVAAVTVTRTAGRQDHDHEVEVASLEDLYDACRRAPISGVVRVTLHGPEGDVRLNFASFVRRR